MNLAVLGACCRALAATPPRLARPRRPDQRLLNNLAATSVDPPRASQSVNLTPLIQARQSAPTMAIAEGVFRPLRLTLSMTSFLIEHPQARFVVDPAVTTDVHDTVLRELPSPFRQMVTPGKPVVGLPELLDRAGTAPEKIQFALPTHLHWDHVSGLLELPGHLPIHTLPIECGFALDEDHLGAVRSPLQGRTFQHYELDGPPVLTFIRSHDLFDDGSVVLVDLAGHTPGSVGVLLNVTGGRRVLLAGDAVWHSLQIRLLREKAPLPGDLVDADRDVTFATLHRLHTLPPHIEVIASHDHTAALAFLGHAP